MDEKMEDRKKVGRWTTCDVCGYQWFCKSISTHPYCPACNSKVGYEIRRPRKHSIEEKRAKVAAVLKEREQRYAKMLENLASAEEQNAEA